MRQQGARHSANGLIAAVLCLFVHIPAAAAAEPFEGQWIGDGIELSLNWDEDCYDGKLRWNGRDWWVELEPDGRGIIYPGDGTETPVALQSKGDGVTMRLGASIVELRRPGAAAPAPKPADPAATVQDDDAKPEAERGEEHSFANAEESAGAGWKTYRHPTGAFLEHPQDWKLQPLEAGIAMVPPDFSRNDELILVLGEPAAGMNGVRDPQVGQYFDQLVATVAPGLRREGEVDRLDTRAGEGAVYQYSGKLNDGRAGRARIQAAIVGPHAVAVAIVGTDAQVAKRAPVVDRVFSSLGIAEAKRDPALVGTWRRSENESDANTTGSYSFRANFVYQLAPDGRMQMQRSTRMNIEGNLGAGGYGKGESQEAGTWSAEDGRLFIVWQDGTTTSAAYEAGPDGLLVRPEGGKAVRLHRAQ